MVNPLSTPKTLIVLNPNAWAGNAMRKWDLVSERVSRELDGQYEVRTTQSSHELPAIIQSAWHDGYRQFVAAGGDGSLNHLINTLMRCDHIIDHQFMIGAIGLGPSNDFHKPCKSENRSVPMCINPRKLKERDIGYVEFENARQQSERYYFVCNASLGVTAQANLAFNCGKGFLGFLKKVSTPAAIAYCAVSTILRYRNLVVDLTINEDLSQIEVSNLAITKSPHVSGSMRYPTLTTYDSGCFAVFVCERMSKTNLLFTLNDLSSGRFGHREGQRGLLANDVEVESPIDIAVEYDGEVVSGHKFKFGLIQKHLKFMT